MERGGCGLTIVGNCLGMLAVMWMGIWAVERAMDVSAVCDEEKSNVEMRCGMGAK
jgi:hypothetical protein